MNRKNLGRARLLVDTMLKHTREGSMAHAMAIELQAILRPPPKLSQIILSLEAENHKERAALIGLSRQGYYNLIQGLAKPNVITAKRIADLTGVSEEAIRDAVP